jgi:DNA polymerase
LSALVQAEKPDVLLIMGRLAVQALLQSAEPLGKLRGQTHQLAGVPAFVTYDAAYLLRSLPDKARAWDDLCLAQVVAGAH